MCVTGIPDPVVKDGLWIRPSDGPDERTRAATTRGTDFGGAAVILAVGPRWNLLSRPNARRSIEATRFRDRLVVESARESVSRP